MLLGLPGLVGARIERVLHVPLDRAGVARGFVQQRPSMQLDAADWCAFDDGLDDGVASFGFSFRVFRHGGLLHVQSTDGDAVTAEAGGGAAVAAEFKDAVVVDVPKNAWCVARCFDGRGLRVARADGVDATVALFTTGDASALVALRARAAHAELFDALVDDGRDGAWLLAFALTPDDDARAIWWRGLSERRRVHARAVVDAIAAGLALRRGGEADDALAALDAALARVRA